MSDIINISADQLPEYIYNGQELSSELIQQIDEEEVKLECLIEVEDAFGSDYICILETGQMILTDRNCGMFVFVTEDSYKRLLESLN